MRPTAGPPTRTAPHSAAEGTPLELDSRSHQLLSNQTGLTAPSREVTDAPRTLRKAGRDTEQPGTRPQRSELCPEHLQCIMSRMRPKVSETLSALLKVSHGVPLGVSKRLERGGRNEDVPRASRSGLGTLGTPATH